MGHTHTVVDSDTNHFVIDPITRQITNETKKLCLVKGDHNSEVFTFEVPLKVEEHDMSLCNRIEVHFINVEGKSTRNKSEKVYEVQDFAVDQDDPNKMTFSWLISGDATKYAGNLSFIVRFACIPDDDGVVAYSWNTTIYSGITVLDTISNSEMVLEEYKDILQEWYNKLIAVTDGAIDMNTKEPVKFWVGTHTEYTELTDIQEDCLYIIIDEDKVKEVSDRVTELKSSLQEEVTARQTADTNLTNSINTLGTGLGNIATELRGADTALANRVSSVENRADDLTERVEYLEAFPSNKKGYIVFSTSSDSLTISRKNTNSSYKWNGELQYRTDSSAWTVWDGTSSITAYRGTDSEARLYMRGVGNTNMVTTSVIDHDSGPSESDVRSKYGWRLSTPNNNPIYCEGNIENLLDYTVVRDGDHPYMSTGCFAGLFSGCTNLVSSPELPAISVGAYCYEYMFNNCAALTTAPDLPATELDYGCYKGMFYGCSSLATAPDLPATSISASCYEYMFGACHALVSPPALPAIMAYNRCYFNMFSGCIALTSIPELPAKTTGINSYTSMFYGCSSLKMSAASSDTYKYAFRIPTSGAMTYTGTDALLSMFVGTGGSFTGDPSYGTTYYTVNPPIS